MAALLMGTYYSFYLPQIINVQINYEFLLKAYISTVLYVSYFLYMVVNPITWLIWNFYYCMQPMTPEHSDYLLLYHNYTKHFYLPRHMDDLEF